MTNSTQRNAVEVVGLSKHYGSVVALDKVSLSIKAGEYFVLLGPSGGGKTTLLRTIGGFHRPTEGQVLLHGQDVSNLPPDKRPTSMVFQSYALFPHMTVLGNVSYGLKLAKLPKKDIRDKAQAMIEMVGLKGYDERKPHELSGGQQQRVQLARALVLDRDILLLDEPLAALDAQLRKDMCLELKHLQEKVGITFIHVTHNQEEAMTVANRIALIADGHLVEHGDATQIYEAPIHRFTASFVGENNLLPGTVVSLERQLVQVDTGAGVVSVDPRGLKPAVGNTVTLSIRSESTSFQPADQAADQDGETVYGTWSEAVYLGLTTSHRIKLANDANFVCRHLSGDTKITAGSPNHAVRVTWPTSAARLHVD